MKNTFKKVMTVFTAVIFLLSATETMAAWSKEEAKGDYRNMSIYTKKNTRVEKPIAQFAVNRISNNQIVDKVISYDGYDCSHPFEEIVCYVGDKITFEDLSRDKNSGGKIVEWDWQYFGSMGDFNHIYNYNILDSVSYECTKPGKTTFYLSVKNNIKVKTGCCDPWSENGDHQIKGTNKWFPKGAYWYFTAVTVNVKAVKEAKVHVRYWDVINNRIIKENTIPAGTIYTADNIVKKDIQLENIDGYSIYNWNVVLPDNTIQYNGNSNSVGVELSEYLNEKYLNVECYPSIDTGVEVRYWDSHANKVLQSEYFPGGLVTGNEEKSIRVNLSAPRGYRISGWNVQLPDGTTQYTGTELVTDVAFSNIVPKKYLNVECYRQGGTQTQIDTSVDIKYYNSRNNTLISETTINGSNVSNGQETKVNVQLTNPSGYIIDSWELILDNGTVQQQGSHKSFEVFLSSILNHKTVKVKCTPDNGSGGSGTQITLPDPTINIIPDDECIGVIEWSETDSHEVPDGYDSNGRRRYKACTHTFKYRAVLNAEAMITPDTFKSGYGFGVNVDCSLSSGLVSNSGSCTSWGANRSSVSVVENPTRATVYIPWTMINKLGTQDTAISMDENGTLKFILPRSNVSHTGERKIYTPVELAGTEEIPVSHSFEIYINGGGVGSVEFCKKLNGTITINGVMYDDDFSGAD